jgi:hypothetical protein
VTEAIREKRFLTAAKTRNRSPGSSHQRYPVLSETIFQTDISAQAPRLNIWTMN